MACTCACILAPLVSCLAYLKENRESPPPLPHGLGPDDLLCVRARAQHGVGPDDLCVLARAQHGVGPDDLLCPS